MDEYLVSQRQAVKMLQDCGLSRRAAYYRLQHVPSSTLVDTRVFSRVDVEVLCERIRLGLAHAHTEGVLPS